MHVCEFVRIHVAIEGGSARCVSIEGVPHTTIDRNRYTQREWPGKMQWWSMCAYGVREGVCACATIHADIVQ